MCATFAVFYCFLHWRTFYSSTIGWRWHHMQLAWWRETTKMFCIDCLLFWFIWLCPSPWAGSAWTPCHCWYDEQTWYGMTPFIRMIQFIGTWNDPVVKLNETVIWNDQNNDTMQESNNRWKFGDLAHTKGRYFYAFLLNPMQRKLWAFSSFIKTHG